MPNKQKPKFICPQCFDSLHPFQCRICDSKDVIMHANIGVKTEHIHPDHDGPEPENNKY